MNTYLPAPNTKTRAIFDALVENGTLSSAECARAAGVDVRTIRASLRRAIKNKVVGLRKVSGNRSEYTLLTRTCSVWDYAKLHS